MISQLTHVEIEFMVSFYEELYWSGKSVKSMLHNQDMRSRGSS